ncbi:hypothetical protein LX32DRAFT_418572 [Colletotrichum zoysiae]|uniref:Uncharacterized protein n=1 Tax=Colletotrichum zoysiae TaxID=1216348 RepID=A0AAD9M5Q5_9PEZI|nr:hypothetical protein LX32DRAFT_418572 [Colletotrichum zoysiae]
MGDGVGGQVPTGQDREGKSELGMNGNGGSSGRKGKVKKKGNGNGNTMERVDDRRESARCRPQPEEGRRCGGGERQRRQEQQGMVAGRGETPRRRSEGTSRETRTGERTMKANGGRGFVTRNHRCWSGIAKCVKPPTWARPKRKDDEVDNGMTG